MKQVCGVLVIACALAASAQSYLSPEFLAPAPDGGAYVTEATAARVAEVSRDGRVVRQWPVAANPTGIAAGGGFVYVTCGEANGELRKYAPDGTCVKTAPVGHSPCGPVLSRDGRTVYVLNRFLAQVSVLDAEKMTVVKTVKALREPFAATLGAEGKLLFVANLLPYCASTNDVVAAAVSVVDTRTFAVRHVMLPNGSTGVRGIASSPDGKNVYVTHTMGRYQLPTTQLERGWMNTAALSVFDGATGAYVNTVLLDDVDRGGANPWGVAVTADGRTLVVAHAGTCELSLIDRAALHDRLAKAAKGESASGIVKSAEDVPNDLAFLVSIRRRVLAGGNGPPRARGRQRPARRAPLRAHRGDRALFRGRRLALQPRRPGRARQGDSPRPEARPLPRPRAPRRDALQRRLDVLPAVAELRELPSGRAARAAIRTGAWTDSTGTS